MTPSPSPVPSHTLGRGFLPLAVALAVFLPLAACGQPPASRAREGDYISSFYLVDAQHHCLLIQLIGDRIYARLANDHACEGGR